MNNREKDRQLLLHAAKAADLLTDFAINRQRAQSLDPEIGLKIPTCELWNPLSNSSQAFHLAVNLGLECDFSDHDVIQVISWQGGNGEVTTNEIGTNKLRSARRAIVIAAAKLGAEK